MNFSVGDTIGQWKIIKFISGHNGGYIYEVCTTITDYDDIIKKFEKIEIKTVDHHTKETDD